MTEMAPLKGKLLSGNRELNRAQSFENVARAAAGFSRDGSSARRILSPAGRARLRIARRLPQELILGDGHR